MIITNLLMSMRDYHVPRISDYMIITCAKTMHRDNCVCDKHMRDNHDGLFLSCNLVVVCVACCVRKLRDYHVIFA